MRRYRVALLAILLVPLAAAAARAEPSVAVLGLEPIDVPEALAQQLTDALRQRAAGTTGIRSVQGKDLIEIKMVFGCDTENPTCLANAGRTLGADKLLYGTLKKAPGRNNQNVIVSLKLLDVRSASVEKFVSTTVQKRELAAGAVSQSAARWFGDLVEVAKPMLTVTSDPTGAAVTVDGAAAGRTPITLRELNAGTHLVTVTMPGRLPFTRNVELRPGGQHEVVAMLEAEKVAVVPPPKIDTTPKVVEHPRVENPIVTPPPLPPARTAGHPGLTAKILAGVAVGGAVITGSIAIYTWRTYSGLQDTAHNDLLALRPAGTPPPDQAQFFQSPGCSPPASLGTGPLVQTYKNHCSSGETYANATTALWVVTGTLAAAGVVSFIIGDRQSRKAHERPSTAQLIKQTLTVAPVFSTSTGGVQAAFEF